MAGKGIQIVVGAEYNGKDLAKAERDIAKLRKQTQSSADKMKEFGAGMSKVGRNLTAFVTLPLAAVGAAAVAASVQFETSMAKITGLVGIAADEVAGMRDGVLEMAGETAKAPQELADALFVVTSAGLRGEEAMAALESAAKASAAGLGETNDIARALSGAMNAYGSDVLGAAEATDIIVATARAGNFETSQFAAAIGNILPIAVEAQAGLGDLGGAVALLTRTNGDAAKSANQVTALLRGFATPSATAKKAFEDMGLSAGHFRDIIGTQGLPVAIQQLDTALGGNRERLQEVLGSSEAVQAALGILNADAETIAATFGDVNNAAGITDDAFATMADTTGFKLQQAMANFKTVLIEIGDVLAPFVQRLSEFASNALEGFRNLPDGAQQLIVAMGAIAAAIGPVLLIGGKLVTMVGTISGAFTGVGGFAGIAAAVTGPVAIIIAAIVGVIAIIVAMWRESEVFRNAVRDAFNVVKDAITGAVDTIKGALESNGEAINILKNIFKALGDFVGTFIIPLWSNYLAKAIEVVAFLLGHLIGIIGMVLKAFQTALPYILDFAAEVVKGIAGMVDFVLGAIEGLVNGVAAVLRFLGMGDILDGAVSAISGFRQAVSETYAGVEAGLRGASDSVEAWGQSSVDATADYVDAAQRARIASGEVAVAMDGSVVAADDLASTNYILAEATNAASAATIALNDAYADLTAFFSETRAIDRAHTLLQEFQAQVSSNSAGFDEMTDAAKANRATFMDWADTQIKAAQSLDDPIERLEALKDIQRTARDALREQGIDPKDSGFFQEVKGIVQAAKDEVDGLKDAQTNAEEAGVDISTAIANGISQGMNQQQSAINGAGLLAGDELAGGMEDSLGISSPSKVAAEAGKNVALGLTQGLSDLRWNIELGGDIAGRTLINSMIAGLNSASGALYARVAAIVNQALATARNAATGGASGSPASDRTNAARGGLIRGPGGPMADLIPAMLSNGEFVVRAQAVNSFGPEFFDALNRGINPMRGMDAPRMSDTSTGAPRTMVIENLNVTSAANEPAEVSVPRALRRLSWVGGLDG